MNIVKFRLDDIRANKKYRPIGYYEDVVSRGVIVGDNVEMTEENARILVEKYSEKNPVAGMSLEPSIWGPILWNELHKRSDIYSGNVESEKRWLSLFFNWIPCQHCQNHFGEMLKKIPPNLDSRESYKNWGIEIHNAVNKEIGKPIFAANKEQINTNPPPIINQLSSFAKSSINFISSGLAVTPDLEIEKRLSICSKCEFWDKEAINKTGRCLKCGCSTWAKLRMATERCPIGKWEAVSVEDSKK